MVNASVFGAAVLLGLIIAINHSTNAGLITVFFLSRGLFLLLLIALPLLFLLTRAFQKRMLAAQVENRKAVAGTNEIIPETMHTIRTIRLTGCEDFMERRYGTSIRRSFSAMEKTNFYDSI